MISIPELFRQSQAELETTLYTPVAHPTTKGDTSEISWGAVLRRFLPGRYRIGTGFAVDQTGQVSQQNDIMIYDEQYSPLWWTNDNAVIVPIESVYAVLEVKQVLNAEHVAAAAEKARSVRALTPTSAPITHLTGRDDVKKPFIPLAGLLTQRAGWSPALGESFRTAMNDAGADGQLDIGCCLQGGAWAIPTGANWQDAQVVPPEHALLFLTTQLYQLLQALGTVPRIDIPMWLVAGGVVPSPI